MIIGITGKSGSGKTTKAEELSKILNIKHLKIDDVCKRAIEKVIVGEKSWLDVFNIKEYYESKRFTFVWKDEKIEEIKINGK